jgi:WD40 repeat protein
VLPRGRLVTGGHDGRVLVWDPATPGAAPAELGRVNRSVRAVALLPGGQVVTGGMNGGRVLLWNPTITGVGPAELGRQDGWVNSVAVLPSGQVVTGGTDWRVLVWDRPIVGTDAIELGCSVTALTAAPLGPSTSCLVIAHQGTGFSIWSIA